ncbi:MAG: two-component sensor histidine kinase [Deltaproteobacteria bacterium]|nr:MAG: two-component sensor histidine kinase [Deltaproteobacteria bacterium]
MFSKHPGKFRGSLAFRLTLWYAVVFTLFSAVAFLMFYLFITSMIRTRIDQDLSVQAGEFATVLKTRGIGALKRVAILEAQAFGEKKIFIRLLGVTGDVFSSSNMSYWRDIDIHLDAIQRLSRNKHQVFETIALPRRNGNIRILYRRIGPGVYLQLGHSMEPYTRFFQAFKTVFIITMGGIVLLAALIGWFMARRALAGVTALTRTARQIADGALEQRVPVKAAGDEIDQMAVTFNRMLDRIQSLIAGIREMSDNIAHDLRSPITRIRGLAEITLTTKTGMEDYRLMAASTIEECDRLLDMITTMLLISRTESGAARLEFNALDVSGLVADACDLFKPAAEDKGVTLICDLPETRILLSGDIRLLQRMVSNLLDNAVKYTPAKGTVRITVQRVPSVEKVSIIFEDTGVGIASDEMPRIFDRFYRGDRSRSQIGAGLGLSLARAVARAHGGSISVESQPGRGSRFIATLPVDPGRDVPPEKRPL